MSTTGTHGQETDDLYETRGFGRAAGFGQRPVLVVVDLTYGFTDFPASPLAGDFTDVVAANRRLIDACRTSGVPIVFTTVEFDPRNKAQAAAVFIKKVPSLLVLEKGSRMAEIDERLGRQPDDTLISKQFASAFFATNLASLLAAEHADTVIVTGVSTSGCVRATAVDALQHGYRVIVPRECCGDRAPGPHEANLFDINQKYGDVISVDEAVDAVNALARDTHTRRAALDRILSMEPVEVPDDPDDHAAIIDDELTPVDEALRMEGGGWDGDLATLRQHGGTSAD